MSLETAEHNGDGALTRQRECRQIVHRRFLATPNLLEQKQLSVRDTRLLLDRSR